MSRSHGRVVTFVCGGGRPFLGMMESTRKGVAMATDNKTFSHDAAVPDPAVHVSQLVKRYGDMVALDYFDLDVN